MVPPSANGACHTMLLLLLLLVLLLLPLFVCLVVMT
jgi:hypothetical protein